MYIYIMPGLCFEERLHFAWLSLLSQNSSVYTRQPYRSQPPRLICHINACAANMNMVPPRQTTIAMQSTHTQKIQSQRGSRDSSVWFLVSKIDIYLQQTNKIKYTANNSGTSVSFSLLNMKICCRMRNLAVNKNLYFLVQLWIPPDQRLSGLFYNKNPSSVACPPR